MAVNPQSGMIPQNIPVPDPSKITSEQINQAKTELRGEMRDKIAALASIVDVRLDAMDKASTLLFDTINKTPTALDREASRLEKLFEERFRSVALQFVERDVRATASETAAKEAQGALSMASTTAVNAALQAQKESAFATQQSNAEAIRKSEAGFTNEINSLKFLINTTKETLAAGVGDLRSRIDVGRGNDVGTREAQTDSHQSLGSTLSVIAGVVSVISLIAMLAFGLIGANHSPGVTPVPAAVAVVPVAPK